MPRSGAALHNAPTLGTFIVKYAAALALCLVASPALAEAVTYQGTIGDEAIFVEFSEPPQAGGTDIFGRYFYAEKGVDIPLHGVKAQRSRLGLVEEVACSADKNNCPHAQDDPPSDPPHGAKWQLEVSADGIDIEGDFSLAGRNLPVTLEQIGTRQFDPATGLQGLTEFAASLFYSGAALTLETSPYDYAKMALFALDRGDAVETPGGRHQYVTDMRTRFHFPRIIDLADGSNPRAANAFLEQRHWMMSLDALSCVAQQYQGFGWNGYNFDAGSLGWWDEEQVAVQYLSPTVMSWTEAGSLSCGYAHPYNHYEYHNLDIANGRPLDLSRIFTGWVARNYDNEIVGLDVARASPADYQWGPDEALLAFVNAHRPSNEELGIAAGEDGCPLDELIASNLAISFKEGDIVHFGMDGLEYAVFACGSDLYDAPITDLRDLLTPEAADYFTALED